MTKAKGTCIWRYQEEFDAYSRVPNNRRGWIIRDSRVDVFHIGYLVAHNDVVVWTAGTDNTFIIILIDMEKLAASINVWL